MKRINANIYNPIICELRDEVKKYEYERRFFYTRYTIDYYVKNKIVNGVERILNSRNMDCNLCEYCVHINVRTGEIIHHQMNPDEMGEDELLKFITFGYTIVEEDNIENIHKNDRYYILPAQTVDKIWNGETVSSGYTVRLVTDVNLPYLDNEEVETRTFTIKGKRFEETKRYKTLLKCIKRLEDIYTDKYHQNSVYKIMREVRYEYILWLAEKNKKKIARRDRYKQLAKERFKSEVKSTIKALKHEIYYKQYLKINSSIHSENAADIFYKGSCSHIEDNEIFHEVEKAWDNYYEY